MTHLPAELKLKIQVIEDHELLRDGLRLILAQQDDMKIVGETTGSNDSLEAARREQPDIVLLDVNLKEVNGLDLLPDLLTEAKAARVILVTGEEDPNIHLKAIGLGALGIVMKHDAARMLIKAIRKVHEGETWVDRVTTAKWMAEIARATEKADPEARKMAQLTEREKEVIALVGEGLKNQAIADRLFIAEGTVRHHLTSIFSKLEVSDRLELVIYAYRYGLVKIPEP